MPFALAAQLSAPDQRVLIVYGDGSFGLNGFEFDTAVRFGLPIVGVVGNDAAWGQMMRPQAMLYGSERLVATELNYTRYDQVVEALGGHGEHVTEPDQIRRLWSGPSPRASQPWSTWRCARTWTGSRVPPTCRGSGRPEPAEPDPGRILWVAAPWQLRPGSRVWRGGWWLLAPRRSDSPCPASSHQQPGPADPTGFGSDIAVATSAHPRHPSGPDLPPECVGDHLGSPTRHGEASPGERRHQFGHGGVA